MNKIILEEKERTRYVAYSINCLANYVANSQEGYILPEKIEEARRLLNRALGEEIKE
jgi:hypothetical protein